MSELIEAQEKARPTVLRILRGHTDDAEDILQEAAMRAIRSASQFRGDSKFSTWFVRIAVRSALMHRRTSRIKYKDKQIPLDDFDVFIHPSENPEEIAIRKEREQSMRVNVHAAIETLPHCAKLAAWNWLDENPPTSHADKAARHNAKVQLKKKLFKGKQQWLS